MKGYTGVQYKVLCLPFDCLTVEMRVFCCGPSTFFIVSVTEEKIILNFCTESDTYFKPDLYSKPYLKAVFIRCENVFQ